MELLAPAGNYDCLVAAVKNGANAVYLGVGELNARSFAGNFDEQSLVKAVDFCHAANVAVYLTLNTIVSDKELADKAYSTLKLACTAGVDAIIVQDIGVAKMIKTCAPAMPIHASTQMTVTNIQGADFLAKHGFSRIVLARELSLEDISYISKNCKAETEIFAHGALCMSYSGQCLMSSIIGGRSGNRGKCAQPCRTPYSNKNHHEKTMLSLKDLSLIDYLSEISKAGVTCIKLEGRMKGVDYVAAVTKTYRKYIDQQTTVSKEDAKYLQGVFNRGGYTSGYFTNNKGTDMICLDKPDNPYKLQSPTHSNEKSDKRDSTQKIDINFIVQIKKGEELHATAVDSDGNTAKYVGTSAAQSAITLELTKEKIIAQMEKLGGTLFCLKDIDVTIDSGVSLPISEINNARRTLVDALMQMRKRIVPCKPFELGTQNKKHTPAARQRYAVQVRTLEQLSAVLAHDVQLIYAPLNEQFIAACSNLNCEVFYVLPRVAHKIVMERVQALILKYGITKIVAGNIGYFGAFANGCGEHAIYNKIKFEDSSTHFEGLAGKDSSVSAEVANMKKLEIVGDFGLNIYNSLALSEFKSFGAMRITMSPELNLAQMSHIAKDVDTEVISYGKLPLMIMENCPIRGVNGCGTCKGLGEITDKVGAKFLVMCENKRTTEIFNCVPIFMADRQKEISRAGIDVQRIMFTDEDKDMVRQILLAYENHTKIDGFKYTRGHFYRGVE